jgi:hypothetical protein
MLIREPQGSDCPAYPPQSSLAPSFDYFEAPAVRRCLGRRDRKSGSSSLPIDQM